MSRVNSINPHNLRSPRAKSRGLAQHVSTSLDTNGGVAL